MFATEIDALNAIYQVLRSVNLLAALILLLSAFAIGIKLAFCIRRSWLASLLLCICWPNSGTSQLATESTLQSVNAKLQWINSDISFWRTEANDFYYENETWAQHEYNHNIQLLKQIEYQTLHLTNIESSVLQITNITPAIEGLTNLLDLVSYTEEIDQQEVIDKSKNLEFNDIQAVKDSMFDQDEDEHGNDWQLDEEAMAIDTRESELTPAFQSAVTAFDNWMTFPVIAKTSLITLGHPAFLLFNSYTINQNQWGVNFDMASLGVASSIRTGLLAAFAVGWVVIGFKTFASGIA